MQTNSLFSYEMRSPTPLMSVSKTDTAPGKFSIEVQKSEGVSGLIIYT